AATEGEESEALGGLLQCGGEDLGEEALVARMVETPERLADVAETGAPEGAGAVLGAVLVEGEAGGEGVRREESFEELALVREEAGVVPTGLAGPEEGAVCARGEEGALGIELFEKVEVRH
ncbi:hypothetical protein WDZ92_33950, partial [Nostoc sp. NIES-2111]